MKIVLGSFHPPSTLSPLVIASTPLTIIFIPMKMIPKIYVFISTLWMSDIYVFQWHLSQCSTSQTKLLNLHTDA